MMNDADRTPSDSIFAVTSPDGRTGVLVMLGLAAILLAATHGAVQQLVVGGQLDISAILEWRVTPVLIWAAATPFLLGAVRAVGPATRGALPGAITAHAALAAGWIVVSNLLMRVPMAVRGEPLAALLVDTARGVIDFGPAAAAAYVGLVVTGLPRSALWSGADPRRPARTDRSRSETPAGARRGAATAHLAVQNGVRIHMVARSDIGWVEADGDHVKLHTGDRSYRTRGTLTACERELAPDGFLRMHRSALVHPRAIREIQPYYRGDHVAILHDGTEIRIPRTRDDVLDALLTPIGRT